MSKNILTYRFIILIFASFISCNDNSENSIKESNKIIKWSSISLQSDFQRIVIYYEKDSIFSRTWKVKDSADKFDECRSYKVRYDFKNEKTYIESENKDTLASCIMDMVTNPVFTNQSATCYAGSLEACIKSDNTELCCNYYSIGVWNTISDNTKKIYTILSRKLKISNQ